MDSLIRTRPGMSVPTTVTLCVVMAGLEWFFIINLSHGNGVEAQAAAWIVSAGFLLLFALIQRSDNLARYRRIFFVSLALLFFPSFIALLVEARGSMFVDRTHVFLNESPMCHIVIPLATVPYVLKGIFVFPARLTNHFASVYAMLVIWLIATVTIGRGWCSWVCFYGGWDDGASRLVRRARLPIADPKRRIRYFNFTILAFSVLAGLATLSSVYCAWLCPFKLVTEYAQVVDAATFVAMVLFVTLFISLVIALPIATRKRVQCMSFCPFGAFQALVGRVSPYRVRIDEDACTSCGRCAQSCPVMAIEETDGGKPRVIFTCVLCGECITTCARGAARYEYSWSRSGGNPKGPAARWRERLEQTGRHRIGRATARFAEEILSARALLTTTGFSIGMIISSRFSVGTLARLLHLFATGSFLLK